MSTSKELIVKYDQNELNEQVFAKLPKYNSWVEQATALTIETPADREKATLGIIKLKKNLDMKNEGSVAFWRNSLVAPLNTAHKNATKMFTMLMDPVKKAIDITTKKVAAWDNEQTRKAREEETRIRQEQEKEAEEERQRILAEAKEAEKRGDAELAAEKKAEAEEAVNIVPFVALPSTPPKVEGLQRRQTWKARVMDVDAVPMEFCKKVPDRTLLNAMARKNNGKNPPAGVEFYCDTSFARID